MTKEKAKRTLTYYQQMQHPLWQKKRLRVMEFHEFKCQECEAEEEQLHVHHPMYKRGAMIWDYTISELMCLCEACHKETHKKDEVVKKAATHLRNEDKHEVAGFINMMVALRQHQKEQEFLNDDYEDDPDFYYGIKPLDMQTVVDVETFEHAMGIARHFKNVTESDIIDYAESDRRCPKWTVLVHDLLRIDKIDCGRSRMYQIQRDLEK